MSDPEMLPPSNTERKKRGFAWTKVLLVASLALNLLIVGVIAGSVLGAKPKDNNPLLRNLGYGPFVGALPSEDKYQMTEALKRQAGSFRENRRELRREFETLLDLLRTDPFDAAQLEAVIMRQSSHISERLELGSELLIERIVAMTPEARAAYADRLDKQLKRRGPDPRGPSDRPKVDRD